METRLSQGLSDESLLLENFLQRNKSMVSSIAGQNGVAGDPSVSVAAQRSLFDAMRTMQSRKGVQLENVFYNWMSYKHASRAKKESLSIFDIAVRAGVGEVNEDCCPNCGCKSYVNDFQSINVCIKCETRYEPREQVSYVSLDAQLGEDNMSGLTLLDILHEEGADETEIEFEVEAREGSEGYEGMTKSRGNMPDPEAAVADYISDYCSLTGDFVSASALSGRGKAIIAEIDGYVSIQTKNGKYIIEIDNRAGDKRKYTATLDSTLSVHNGDYVSAGNALISGRVSPQTLKFIQTLYLNISGGASDVKGLCRILQCKECDLPAFAKKAYQEISDSGLSAYRVLVRNGKDVNYIVWGESPEVLGAYQVIPLSVAFQVSCYGEVIDVKLFAAEGLDEEGNSDY